MVYWDNVRSSRVHPHESSSTSFDLTSLSVGKISQKLRKPKKPSMAPLSLLRDAKNIKELMKSTRSGDAPLIVLAPKEALSGRFDSGVQQSLVAAHYLRAAVQRVASTSHSASKTASVT